MKKSHKRIALVASLLSLAAASAQAQSNVSLYGLVDMSIGATKAPGGTSVTGIDSGKMTTSYYGMSANEDLGGGLSAVFKLEGFFLADTGAQGRFTGDAQFARTASVGLSHRDYGTLTLGRNTTQLFVSTLMFNAFGDSFGYSPSIRHYFAGGQGVTTGDTGWNDSIAYSSPTFAGLRFGVAAATKESALGTGNSGNLSVSVGYSNGPLAASLVVQDVEKDTAVAVANTTTSQLGASYDFGVAKAFAQYGRVKNDSTGAKYDITGLGVRVPVGSGAVIAQWGELNAKVGADRTTLSVGYLHNLSKRTELYAVLMHDKVDGLSSGGGYSLGIRHRF